MSSFMFVFLTGRDKGKTRIYQQDRVTIGPSDTCDLVVPIVGMGVTAELIPLPDVIASVKRVEDGEPRLTLKVGEEVEFAINGKTIAATSPGESFPLHDGDTLRFGPAGRGSELLFHMLRQDIYGLVPVSETPDTAIAEVPGNVHPLTATLFVKELATSLWAEVPGRAKAYTLGSVFAILFLVALVIYLNFYQLRSIQETVRLQQEQIEMDRKEKAAAQSRLEEQQRRLDELGQLYADNRSFAQRMSEKYSSGVCLIVGVYSFTDRESGKPLKYDTVDDANGPVVGETGELLASVDGLGPQVEVEFTGTGFMIAENTLLTNRHVVQPWRQDETAQVILSQGMRPKIERLIAYFPQFQTPFEVQPASNTDQVDLAICRIKQGDKAIPVLPMPSEDGPLPVPGKAIVLLGYPTGVEGLVERLPEADRVAVMGRGNRSLLDVARILADRGAIRPLTTQGIIGDITPGRIVHNAATTEGGSGGPIFDDSGRVIGINSAILVSSETGQSFAGSNFAIPVASALPIIREWQAKGPG
jgi:S1-C subfamily serine protease